MLDRAPPGVSDLTDQDEDIMGEAFEAAWAEMREWDPVGTPTERCDQKIRLAHIIVQLVDDGERDILEISKRALASVKQEAGPAKRNSVGL
jgi:hypothetical protein